MEWNFFATRHGKSQADAHSSAVKSAAKAFVLENNILMGEDEYARIADTVPKTKGLVLENEIKVENLYERCIMHRGVDLSGYHYIRHVPTESVLKKSTKRIKLDGYTWNEMEKFTFSCKKHSNSKKESMMYITAHYAVPETTREGANTSNS
jgi:hypothetical protein